MTYNIKQLSYRNFVVEKEYNTLFKMKYPSMWCNSALGETMDSDYEIEKANFWATQFRVKKEGREIGIIKYNWNGNIRLFLEDENKEVFQIQLKYRGFWKPKFHVYFNGVTHILTLRGHYRGFRVDWSIEKHHHPPIKFPLADLIGLIGYSMQYYRQLGYY